ALLIMAATGDYLFSVGNVLIGLKKHSPNMFDDIIIYTDETATEQDKETIQKIFPVKFKIYDFQIKNLKDRDRLQYYSNMTYARFEFPDYLNEYKKVFWFDSDFLITDDISGLLQYGNTGISMSIDLDPYPENHSVRAFFVKDVPNYDMNAKAYATGLIIFSDKIKNYNKLKEYLYKKVDKYSEYIRYADQGIIHMMIEDFSLQVEEFPKLIYHAFPFEDKSKAKLIHLLGKSKPWISYMGFAYTEWYENHKKWISLGGREADALSEIIKENQIYFYGENRYQNILQISYFDNLVGNICVPHNKASIYDNENIIKDIGNYTKNKIRYWRYRLLSKITFGKKRKKYKQKRKELKVRLKQVRAFLKGK
ncbi:MAG: glycosyltransferase, partial [Pseudomonadota bacterium]|nr:glycosyltransferase [Pseudomonadota bacterium]